MPEAVSTIRKGELIQVNQVDDTHVIVGIVQECSEDDGFLFRKLDGELTWLSSWAMRSSSWKKLPTKKGIR